MATLTDETIQDSQGDDVYLTEGAASGYADEEIVVTPTPSISAEKFNWKQANMDLAFARLTPEQYAHRWGGRTMGDDAVYSFYYATVTAVTGAWGNLSGTGHKNVSYEAAESLGTGLTLWSPARLFRLETQAGTHVDDFIGILDDSARLRGTASDRTIGLLGAGTDGPIGDLLYGARVGEGLPGLAGVKIARRPTIEEMELLASKHQVEFAAVYRRGAGVNGGGGQYFLYSGTKTTVGFAPLDADTILVYHTHPEGYPSWASKDDKQLLGILEALGSPQRTSYIIPVGETRVVPFTKK